MARLRLRVVSPTRKLFDKEVDMIIMRASEGDLGVMAGHIPLTTTLSMGALRIFDESAEENAKERMMAVLGGFAEIRPDCVTILSDSAEWPDEIDIKRAEAAKERAERRMNENSGELDVQRASLALRRALVRIEVSSYPLIKSGQIKK